MGFPRFLRRSIRIGMMVLCALLIGIHIPFPTRAATSPEIRGVWLTINDSDVLKDQPKVAEAFQQLARLNFNTLYPVVWNAGYTLYPSKVAQESGIQLFVRKGIQGQDTLKDLVIQAHRNRLLVIPWFEFGFMAPSTSELAVNHPRWITQRRDGSQLWTGDAGEVVWLNPFHPQVQEFIQSLVLEIITEYDVDGIQFDDHTSLPFEFGYDPFTVALYRQETGSNPPTNPSNPNWVKWRANKITAFMAQLNRAIKARKPTLIFSVSPHIYDFAYKNQLQDWLGWVKQGLVDEVLVQVYRPDLATFNTLLDRPELRQSKQRIPTGVGILTGLRNRPVKIPLIQAKMRAARNRGFGFSFFSFETLWEDAPEPAIERQTRFLALMPQPMLRSRLPLPTPTPIPSLSPASPAAVLPKPKPIASPLQVEYRVGEYVRPAQPPLP